MESRSARCGQRVGGINEYHRNAAPPIVRACGRGTGDGRLITGSLQVMDSGQTVMAVMNMDSWGKASQKQKN